MNEAHSVYFCVLKLHAVSKDLCFCVCNRFRVCLCVQSTSESQDRGQRGWNQSLCRHQYVTVSHESSVFKLFTLSLDVQQDPSSVLMTLICMYSLSHFSCNLARPIFSSVGDCGQTVPVSHQTQSHRYTHVQSIGFLLVYETVILKCSWYDMDLKSGLTLFPGTILFAGQINKPWARDQRRFDQLSTQTHTHTHTHMLVFVVYGDSP